MIVAGPVPVIGMGGGIGPIRQARGKTIAYVPRMAL